VRACAYIRTYTGTCRVVSERAYCCRERGNMRQNCQKMEVKRPQRVICRPRGATSAPMSYTGPVLEVAGSERDTLPGNVFDLREGRSSHGSALIASQRGKSPSPGTSERGKILLRNRGEKSAAKIPPKKPSERGHFSPQKRGYFSTPNFYPLFYPLQN